MIHFGNAGTPGEETYTLDNTGPTVTADPTSAHLVQLEHQ